MIKLKHCVLQKNIRMEIQLWTVRIAYTKTWLADIDNKARTQVNPAFYGFRNPLYNLLQVDTKNPLCKTIKIVVIVHKTPSPML